MKSRRSIRPCVEHLECRVLPATTIGPPPTPPPPYALWGSTNWSGIDLNTTKGAVTAVSGSWVVPTVTGSGYGYSSTWVGIDGDQSSTVEQIGIEADTAATAARDGTPQYYAWYEMYPAFAHYTTPNTVSPGDQITASVVYVGQQRSGNRFDDMFELSISDLTQNWTFTTTQAVPSHKIAQRNSAEWIVEAPSSGSILPLANFGSVTFTGAQATINGTTGTIASFVGNPAIINYGTVTEPREINIIDMGTFTRFGQWTSIKDETSLLNSSGDSFTVQFGSTNPSPPSNGPLSHAANDRVGAVHDAQLSVPPVNNLGLMVSPLGQSPAAITVATVQERIPTDARPVTLTTPDHAAIQATTQLFADRAAVAAVLNTDLVAAIGRTAGVEGRASSLADSSLLSAPLTGFGEETFLGTPHGPSAEFEFANTPPGYVIDDSVDQSVAAIVVLTVALYSWNGVKLGDDETIRERERKRLGVI